MERKKVKKYRKTTAQLDAEIDAVFAQSRSSAKAAGEVARAVSALDRDPAFLADYWKSTFVETVLKAMEEQKITRKQLANRLGRSPQYVGRILNETANFTIETMVKIALALDRQPYFGIHKNSERVETSERLSALPTHKKKKIRQI